MKKLVLLFSTAMAVLALLHPAKAFAYNCEIDLYAAASEKKLDSGIGFHCKGTVDISAIFSQEFKECNSTKLYSFELQNLAYNPYTTQRYGALLRIKKEHFFCDMTLYAGTLRYSGSYSLLKNPCLASSSALHSLTFLPCGIRTALPAFSSARQMESIAIKTPVFSGVYFENGTHSWSIYKSFSHISVAVSGAEFIYGRKKSKSWFPKERYFAEKKYASYDAELCFATHGSPVRSVLTSCNAAGIIENPFGGLEKSFLWARTQNAIRMNNLVIQTAAFHSWSPLMTLPSGSKCGTSWQFMLNPKIILHPQDGTFRLGFSVQKNEKVKTSIPHDDYDEFIFKCEACYTCSKTKIDMSYSAAHSEKTEKMTYKAKASASHTFMHVSFNSSVASTFYTDKTTLTVSESMSTSTNPSLALKVSDSFTYKNGIYDSATISGAATIIFKSSHAKWYGKINVSTRF